MRFLVLGPLGVVDGNTDLTPTAPKVREVLALLLLRHNRLVPTSTIIDELWPENPPASAMQTLQTYIYKIRKSLTRGGYGNDLLITKPQGYIITFPPENLDLHLFEQLTTKGSRALEAGDPGAAAAALTEALALWRGPALADIRRGELLSANVTALEESRLRALELRIDADLQLGRHRDVIRELKELVTAHRLHEGFHTRLMLALYRSGRRSEALEVYHALRRLLVDELGVEPSLEARRLQRSLLSCDPALDFVPRPSPPAPSPSPQAPLPMTPAQLPPDVAVGVDSAVRDRALRHLTGTTKACTAARIVTISGMPGAGKTALAVHIAHRVRSFFPHGQFFVALNGATPHPADPADVLHGFLRAAHIPDEQIPPTLDERSKLFRTWTASRAVLVVLDEADAIPHIQALLPSSARCAAILTARSGLHGLPGAETIDLDLPSVDAGVTLLKKIVGRELTDAELQDAKIIIRLCGRLPLAIRIAGARLAATRGWTFRKLAQRLARPEGRLDELRFGDLDVRARFDVSYQRLNERERSALRLLSLLDGAEFTVHSVARMLGTDADQIDPVLARLVENHFLQAVVQPLSGEIRYTFHELIRLYAREQLEAELRNVGA
ncbi:AfsR/SARP family transcriptional regulator [Thermostaphylospora chromogena]|uniref:DNA-binding transcriptional activator of the SARP family n=1 Tax=Thermostaphylospora chromogena TaxID=35622 RepID=A0A1H1A7H4_9ACTN|nr:AfsR/SARP family transcriptional regulator [Thermostaphylospora chromogena]SDQ35607.1 DNA-binding transcriptional activator of the SARP family [Thermostaphylospora chromogena]